jgi:hypothetical protein
MQIKILTKEESDALVESFYKERKCWTTEEIIADAKFMKGMPDMGNTKYITGEENWNNFFEWLSTSEAREQWNLYFGVSPLARYYAWKYQYNKSDEEINDMIKNQVS